MGDAVAGGGSLRGRSAAAALSTVNNPIVLNMVMNPAVLSRAKNAVVTRIMIFITLIPLVCRGPRTIDGGTPYSPPAVERFHRCISLSLRRTRLRAPQHS